MADAVLELSERDKIAKEVREELDKEYQAKLATEANAISAKLIEENQKAVNEAIARLKKELQPPSAEDIQKLLEQEYLSFKVNLRLGKEDVKEFVIQELPQKVEKKMYAKLREGLVPMAKQVAELTVNLTKGDADKKIVQFINAFEPLLDMLAEMTAIVLNPFGDEKEITKEWVQEHLSSTRMISIMNAQVQANRMRDFLSLVSQTSKSVAT